MSQVPQPLSMLPLFADPAPAPVRAVHDAAEAEHAAFLDRVRRLLAGHYAGSGIEVTTDHAHDLMDRYGIKPPAGASPNLLGTLFSGWDRARSTGRMVRSKRRGANGNVLICWKIY